VTTVHVPSSKAATHFKIGGAVIAPGEARTVEIPVAPTYAHDDLAMSVHVVHGKRAGPALFVCAAIHGDEINGIEIIRRLVKRIDIKKLRGTLLAIPIVNVYGVIAHSRYLPDGRDLNRSFPGSATGSLTGRVAHTFMQEIVAHCTHGIDLHTGGRHRSNFPQIRAELTDPAVRAMTEAFGAPLVINSAVRDGSLRQCATEMGVPVILYESCEALRFDEVHIRAGLKGIINVMRHLGMLRKGRAKTRKKPIFSRQTQWVRAPASGIHRMLVTLGAQVADDQVIGVIADPLGIEETEVRAPRAGVIIGRSNLPLVYAGDALFHIADMHEDAVFEADSFHEELMPSDFQPPEDDPSSAPIAV